MQYYRQPNWQLLLCNTSMNTEVSCTFVVLTLIVLNYLNLFTTKVKRNWVILHSMQYSVVYCSAGADTGTTVAAAAATATAFANIITATTGLLHCVPKKNCGPEVWR